MGAVAQPGGQGPAEKPATLPHTLQVTKAILVPPEGRLMARNLLQLVPADILVGRFEPVGDDLVVPKGRHDEEVLFGNELKVSDVHAGGARIQQYLYAA